MRPPCGISVLPADLHQQLLDMPLTDDERREAADALCQLLSQPETEAFYRYVVKNAPQPDWLRGA